MSLNTFETFLKKFFFSPASPAPLAALRIGVSAVLLWQAFQIAPNFFDLYATNGILQGTLRDYFNGMELPDVASLSRLVSGVGISERTTLGATAIVYIASLVTLLLGYQTRIFAIVAWFAHMLLSGAHFTSYGVDKFAHIFLFYLMFSPAGDLFSLDRWAGRTDGTPSSGARFTLRVMQLHLAVSYFFSGFDKAMGGQWRDGDAIWRTLMLPQYAQFDFSWLAFVPSLTLLAGLGTLVIEMGYPLFMAIPKTRRLWVPLTLSLHLGIALFMGLEVFGIFMSVLTLALFGVSSNPTKALSAAKNPDSFQVLEPNFSF